VTRNLRPLLRKRWQLWKAQKLNQALEIKPHLLSRNLLKRGQRQKKLSWRRLVRMFLTKVKFNSQKSVEVLKKVSTQVEIKLYLKALRKRRPLHPRLLPKQLKLKSNLQLQEVL
jgi:hypothetical protein